ncbi:Peroxiredoxin [Sphingobacterium nematocida]|uniref:Peroxiredoxin n=1 Tax=Sphingobacterium nematocida TaxID=1513896 RepID=A0A1T5AWV6_9SPHI|nr:TlpA disulfide reductase family protein [Sphingobacterium nematocida]SKB39445.1 Peroxiredoxin [Sphingobacterium nematocida]
MLKIAWFVWLNILAFSGFAQGNNPVSWEINSEKIADLTYRINMNATIKEPYHIYPQQSSGGGLGMPTEITFTEADGLEFIGATSEKGEATNAEKRVPYYAKGVTFAQVVRLKSDAPFVLSIKIKSQACNDRMCLPPSIKRFSLTVNGDEVLIDNNSVATGDLKRGSASLRYEDFQMEDTAGTLLSSNDIVSNSKYTFIDFWASWCAPCRIQGRELIPLYDRYKSKGFQVIGVSLDTEANKWKNAIKADGYQWTNLSDLKGFESPIVKTYNITAIPRNFIVDSKGIIVATDLHGDALEAKLKELLVDY